MQEARAQALDLDSLNQARKEIEQGMKLEALEICRNLTALSDELPMGIALFQPDWHQGVLGIVALESKINTIDQSLLLHKIKKAF